MKNESSTCSASMTHDPCKIEIPLFKKYIQNTEGSLSTNEDLINSSATHSPHSSTLDKNVEQLTFQSLIKQQQD